LSSWHSYCSIFNLGHKAVKALLTVPVNVEEKVDGSQFSFGVFFTDNPDSPSEVSLRVRSKGVVMNADAPEKMFTAAVGTAKGLIEQLRVGWTYRCEYLSKPKHNTLAYERTPKGHLIVFDVNTGDQEYLGYDDKRAEAERLGLECVSLLKTGFGGLLTLDEFKRLLETPSVLGGQLIEGVVIKPALYNLYGPDKKVLMGKHVSETFKEAHRGAWKETSPHQGDILERLANTYGVQGRWMKAVQHLREAGQITDSPKDIGPLLREIQADVEKECADEIKDVLYAWALPHVRRRATGGFPGWYKEELLKKQFNTPVAA
jgi:hypothetical protein